MGETAERHVRHVVLPRFNHAALAEGLNASECKTLRRQHVLTERRGLRAFLTGNRSLGPSRP